MSNLIKSKYFNVYKGRTGFGMMYECGDYDENRHTLIIQLIFISIYIKLPWKNKEWDCDPKCYGIETYRTVYKKWYDVFDQLYVRFGRRCWFIEMPWYLDWVYTAIKFKDSNTWILDDYISRKANLKNQKFFKNVYKIEPIHAWKDLEFERKMVLYEYDYTYKPLNQTSHCNYYVCERCWRPKWFKWTDLFSLKQRVIEVEFDKEMGPNTDSWKGGTIACSFVMNNDETAEECIKRMEKEYVF